MNVWSAGVSSLAHGVHFGIVAVGLAGLLALLGPRWWGGPASGTPRDDHERRVAALHHQISTGSLGTTTLTAPVILPQAMPPPLSAMLVPIIVISSTAASGVHAALGPMHSGELVLFGVFFISTAIAQLVWSVLMVASPTRSLLALGVAGNAALLGLWIASRTVGLPFGLLPLPEPVGWWDLTCAIWETAVVLGGLHLLRRRPEVRLTLPRYNVWPTQARLWLLGSLLVLGVLTLSGARG